MNPILIKSIDYNPDYLIQIAIATSREMKGRDLLDLNYRALFAPRGRRGKLKTLRDQFDATSRIRGRAFLALASITPVAVFLTFWTAGSWAGRWLLKRSEGRRAVLRKTLFGVQIGDCVASQFLRQSSNRGLLRWEFGLIRECFNVILNVLYSAALLRLLAPDCGDPVYFYCPETTYENEAVRRYLLSVNCTEIRRGGGRGKVEKIPPLYGFQIQLAKYAISGLKKVAQRDMLRELHDLTYRTTTYTYMRGFDVSAGNQLMNDQLEGLYKQSGGRVAVIYLHLISDAQYFFGVDCFEDLHDWLVQSVRLLGERNVAAIVKLHPSFFNPRFILPVDINYLKELSAAFGVEVQKLRTSELQRTAVPGVWILGPAPGIVHLHAAMPDFLCVTHHGSVAVEAVYLGHTALASKTSPYWDMKDSILTYGSPLEYCTHIEKWLEGKRPDRVASLDELARFQMARRSIQDSNEYVERLRALLACGVCPDADLHDRVGKYIEENGPSGLLQFAAQFVE